MAELILPWSAPPLIAFWSWSPGDATALTFERLPASAPHAPEVIVLGGSRGFADALNEAARSGGHRDLAIVADAVLLPDGWLERLHNAACADDTIAGVSALVAEPARTAAISALSEPVHPRVVALRPHCAYIRRIALDLVGSFAESLSHPQAVLAEFSARALSRGLSCILADDVIVERLAGGLAACPEAELAEVSHLHPWLAAAREEQDALELGPLRRALVGARVARKRLSVTIDARALGPTADGTQNYVAALVLALAGSARATVRAVVRDGVPTPLIDTFERAGVEVVGEQQAADGIARTDIAHRPQQVFVPEDLSLLRRLGERLVITHLDLIAYRNPTYHSSPDEWRRYRRVTRLALGAADRVVFLSDHARRDAIAEELIEPRWTAVAGVGSVQASAEHPQRPNRVPPGRDLLVMIGSDYFHKNRLFALELIDELRQRHGWDGLFALAGTHVAHGGSAAAEAALLRERPELAAHVLDLGPVSEAEKRWLLENGQALICASTYEGFGLTPLEAASAGIPCVYVASTSLSEVAGADAATIVPWDPAASADQAFTLLRAGEQRDRHLASLTSALARFGWEAIVQQLCELYREVFAAPYPSAVPRAWEDLEREQLIVDLDDAHKDLQQRVDHGLSLIDRGGLLTSAQQRGLMRVASRPWLRGPLLCPFGVLGSLRADADADDTTASSS